MEQVGYIAAAGAGSAPISSLILIRVGILWPWGNFHHGKFPWGLFLPWQMNGESRYQKRQIAFIASS
jgi:hypothetical protein